MKNVATIVALMVVVLLISSTTCWAASPWFGEAGDKTISVTYVSESFDEIWKKNTKGPLGGGNSIDHRTLWFRYEQHLADDMAYSVTTGWTESEFDPATRGDFDGRADTLLDLKYLLYDEFSREKSYPTVSARAGITIAGTYPASSAGNPHSPGDQADGLEASVLLGKMLSNMFSVFGELGYRYRNNDVPNDLFYNVGVSYQFENGLRFDTLYVVTEGQSGTDIGQPGFSPNEFEKLREERSLIDVGLFFPVADSHALGVHFANVIEGRNTGKSDILSLTYTYGFADL